MRKMAQLLRDMVEVVDPGPVEERRARADGFTLSVVTFRATVDGAPLLKGLPEDKCHCAHWGYVTKGEVSFVVGGEEQVYRAGDHFYIPPTGHTPAATADSQYVMFSPTDELAKTEAVMEKNIRAMMGGE
jgi:glyoxylate utilization-related uncharacterized protein